VNITPTLPSPSHLPPEQDRRAVSAVQATRRARDAADDAQDRQAVRRPTPVDDEEIAARIQSLAPTPMEAGSMRANRALSAYAEVADDSDRSELRRLLGFDAYA
jgi:hypothetical protein